MSNTIQKIVSDLEIAKKRETLYQNREQILHLNYQMSNLTFHHSVGRYAYLLDEIEYLTSQLKKCKKE